MYTSSWQEQESFKTLGTDLLNDTTGEVIESFELYLEKAKQTIQALSGTERGDMFSVQLAKAFDAAEQIIQSARTAKLQVG
jgi:hypothetical protein